MTIFFLAMQKLKIQVLCLERRTSSLHEIFFCSVFVLLFFVVGVTEGSRVVPHRLLHFQNKLVLTLFLLTT